MARYICLISLLVYISVLMMNICYDFIHRFELPKMVKHHKTNKYPQRPNQRLHHHPHLWDWRWILVLHIRLLAASRLINTFVISDFNQTHGKERTCMQQKSDYICRLNHTSQTSSYHVYSLIIELTNFTHANIFDTANILGSQIGKGFHSGWPHDERLMTQYG